MSIPKLEDYLRNLKNFFDEVTFYDLDDKIEISFDAKDELIVSDIVDNKKNALILNSALKEKKRMVEIEYVKGRAYETITKLFDKDGKNWVLKVKFNIGQSVIVGALGTDDLVEKIMEHNVKMYKDPLTEVYNRSYFDSHLMGTDVNALLMIDVDDFKDVNDQYGHQKGDEVLQVIAKTIEKAVKSSGIVVRYGGDEFVVLFSDISKQNFVSKMKDICKNVNEIKLPNFHLNLSVSVGGIYGYTNLKDMIGKADKLMYESKKQKNFFTFTETKKDA